MSEHAPNKRKAESQVPEEPDLDNDNDAPEPTPTDPADESTTKLSPADRIAHFRALRLRLKDSKKQNRHDLFAESARMKQDPTESHRLSLKKSIAAEKLAKLEAQDNGEDFERKRAWDWSIEESEAWDARVALKKRNRETSGFADYAQEAATQYARQTRDLKPDIPGYLASKQSSSTSTSDASQHQVSQADSPTRSRLDDVSFIHQKPQKEKIDALIAQLSKSDAARLKAQIKRGRGTDDDGDYISDRNQVFNAKVKRFYDKYTKDMKDSFERGTAQ